MGFSWQEYWSGLPFPPPEGLSDPGIEPASSELAGRFFTTEPPEKPHILYTCLLLSSSPSNISNSLQLHGLQAMASLSMGFSRKEYWSGLPFPPPEGLPDPEIKPASPELTGRFLSTEPPGKPHAATIEAQALWRQHAKTREPVSVNKDPPCQN